MILVVLVLLFLLAWLFYTWQEIKSQQYLAAFRKKMEEDGVFKSPPMKPNVYRGLNMYVEKRNGSLEEFTPTKISRALEKASSRLEEKCSPYEIQLVSEEVAVHFENLEGGLDKDIISVNEVHEQVENQLILRNMFSLAKSYISYRVENKRSIFKPRAAYKPFEYPDLNKFVDAIQQSYWIHTEFDFSSDVQDFNVTLKDHQREAIRRCMLAISQVEVKVKDFWGKVGDVLCKPEIQEVGATFAESEVRHSRAYSFLLELLGLNEDFSEILEVPVFRKRFEYLSRSVRGSKSEDLQDYVEALLLFTLFVENVSLFSQFLIISSYNRELNVLSGMSNAIAATSLEENLHAMFGADLIKEIRKERPDIFTEDFCTSVEELAKITFEAESELVDWIFEKGEDDFLNRSHIKAYIKKRMNSGLTDCGFNSVFEVNEKDLEKTAWFDVQINSTMQTDFFKKRSNTYTKRAEAYSADSLF